MSAPLIFLIVSLALFVAFFAWTVVEAQTGMRVFNGSRQKLDRQVMRARFIVRHVNWSEFLAHMVQSIGARIVHDSAHWTLILVRFIERELTGVVRYLRDRRPNLLAPRPSRSSIAAQTINYVQKMMPRSRNAKKREDS